MKATPKLQINHQYQYGWSDKVDYAYTAPPGLSPEVVQTISHYKNEPTWMRTLRLKTLAIFLQKPLPNWGADLSGLDFSAITYYATTLAQPASSWDDLPQNIKTTYEKIGIPQAERKYLAGVKSQYDSEVIYGSLQKALKTQGVIFQSMDEGLKSHPDIVKRYFGTIVPPADNKFAALNTAVWSGGSFVYVPKGVKVKLPLQAYFRINRSQMGQFERTLIIAEAGSEVSYVEGCFTKGTLITTKSGYKTIETIKTRDQVQTHRGLIRTVIRTQTRKYTGPLYTIKFYGDSSLTLQATEEHPFLTAKRQRPNERNKTFKPYWQPIKHLQRMDYLAMPVNLITKSHPTHNFEITRGGGRWHPPQKVSISVPSSPELFRLIGYYLAEGSISNNSYLNFSFGSHEQTYINDVKHLLKKVFHINKFYESHHKTNHGISVVVASVDLARIFAHFGTSSDTKQLPQWVMSEDVNKQKEAIIGLFHGDGNYYNQKCKHGRKEIFRINTTSFILTRQIRDILLRLGIIASINKRIREKEGRKILYTLGIGGEFIIPFGKLVGIPVAPIINSHKRATLFTIKGKYAYFPIKKITKRAVKNIPVYNFSVKQDESYIAAGVAVHNCTAPSYTTDSLHSAVVEIIVKPRARVRYTTIQNWSANVYNLVTKRARVEEEGIMEWVDANLGSKTTMKYP